MGPAARKVNDTKLCSSEFLLCEPSHVVEFDQNSQNRYHFVLFSSGSNLCLLDPDSPVTYFTFQNSLFLVFMNRTVAFWIAICLLIHQNRKAANRSFFSIYQPPLYAYMYCSLSNILSSWCQYEALKYISFPVQVSFDSIYLKLSSFFVSRFFRKDAR